MSATMIKFLLRKRKVCDMLVITAIKKKGLIQMRYRYETKGTCAKLIEFTVEDGIVKDVKYTGGCSGNQKGIGMLVEGMKAEDVIKRLSGIRCGLKSTSCPDQLAKALTQVLENKDN